VSRFTSASLLSTAQPWSALLTQLESIGSCSLVGSDHTNTVVILVVIAFTTNVEQHDHSTRLCEDWEACGFGELPPFVWPQSPPCGCGGCCIARDNRTVRRSCWISTPSSVGKLWLRHALGIGDRTEGWSRASFAPRSVTEYLGRLHSRCRMAKSLRLSHTVILDSSTAGLLSHVYRAWRLSSALTSNIIGTPYVQTEGQPVLRYSVSLPQSAPFSGRCLLPPYGTAWLTLMPVGRKPYHSIDSCGILSAVLLPRAAPFDMIKLSDLTEVRLIRQPAQPALRPLTRRSSSGNIPQYNQGREGPRPYGVPQYCK
jgi:hypothetical protein